MRQLASRAASWRSEVLAAEVVGAGDGGVAGAADLDDGVRLDQVGGDLGEPLGEPFLVRVMGSCADVAALDGDAAAVGGAPGALPSRQVDVGPQVDPPGDPDHPAQVGQDGLGRRVALLGERVVIDQVSERHRVIAGEADEQSAQPRSAGGHAVEVGVALVEVGIFGDDEDPPASPALQLAGDGREHQGVPDPHLEGVGQAGRPDEAAHGPDQVSSSPLACRSAPVGLRGIDLGGRVSRLPGLVDLVGLDGEGPAGPGQHPLGGLDHRPGRDHVQAVPGRSRTACPASRVRTRRHYRGSRCRRSRSGRAGGGRRRR